jgi:cysteinyl-tRNA synthetase
MSKSLGNIFPVREILKNYHPEVLRLFMLQSHYRSPVDYSEDSLNEARTGLIRGYRALKSLKEAQSKSDSGITPVAQENSAQKEDYVDKFNDLAGKFDAAMDDDFNTAQALGHVFDMVRLTNNFIVDEQNMPDDRKARILAAAKKIFDHFGAVLGVFQNDADNFFMSDKKNELRKRGLDIEKIEDLIQQRQVARNQKDWARADAIRKELAQFNIVLKDSADGTSWMIE